MWIARLHNFCINEGNKCNVSIKNIEENQDCDSKSMPLTVNKSGIPGSYVLRDIIVNDMVILCLESCTSRRPVHSSQTFPHSSMFC